MSADSLAGLFRKIDGFRELPDNWDSYGSIQIEPKAMKLAKRIANALDMGYEWQAVPTNDGGVQLESHTGGLDIEIEISVSESK